MTYENDYSITEEVLEQICEDRFDALPDLVRIMINTAMKIERQKHLGAGTYERTPERQGYANGYKPKTMATRVGKITFRRIHFTEKCLHYQGCNPKKHQPIQSFHRLSQNLGHCTPDPEVGGSNPLRHTNRRTL